MHLLKEVITQKTKKMHVLALSDDGYNGFLNELKGALPPKCHQAVIDLVNVVDLDVFFNLFVKAYNFPDYFGYNWAAFNECMNEPDDPASSYVLVIKNFNKLKLNNKDILIFLKILNDTVKQWITGRNYDSFPTPPTPFNVVFVCEKEDIGKVSDILRQNGIDNTEIILN